MLLSKPPPNPPAQSPLSTLITTSTSQLQSSTLLAVPLEILHNLTHQHTWSDLRLHHLSADGDLHTLPFPVSIEASESNRSISPNAQANGRAIPSPEIYLLSGVPPRPAYTHPDLQALLLKHGIKAEDLQSEREWVLPVSIAQRDVGVRLLARVFDALPEREVVVVRGRGRSTVTANAEVEGEDDTANATDNTAAGLGLQISSSSSPSTTTLNPDASTVAKVNIPTNYPTATTPAETRHKIDIHQPPKRVVLAMKSHDGFGGDGTIAYYVCNEGEVKPRQNG